VIAIAAAVIVILGAGVAWSAYRVGDRQASCTSRLPLDIAAAPEIAPAVQNVASQWAAARYGDSCVSVAVRAEDPADVAAAVANQRGVTLSGTGAPSDKARVPHIWIPDSTSWLQRLRGVGTGVVPADTTSLAKSPVVLAVPQPVAKALGAQSPLAWTALLQKMSGGVKAGVVEPGRDAAGLNTLLALQAVATQLGAQGQPVTVAALRALAANRSPLRAEMLARFPRAADQATIASALSAGPMPEQAVIAFNSSRPPVPLVAVYLEPAPAALDYPFTIMPGTSQPVATAAGQLLTLLVAPSFRNQLAQFGLRGPDGTGGTGFTPAPGAPRGPLPPAPAVEPAVIAQVLSNWATLIQPGRILAVIDVSGSMKTPVPTAGGLSREDVTVRAAAGGLRLFDDTWAVGLWTFSTNMDGPKPYRELLPIGPLSSQRGQLAAALGTVAVTKGDTGLYEHSAGRLPDRAEQLGRWQSELRCRHDRRHQRQPGRDRTRAAHRRATESRRSTPAGPDHRAGHRHRCRQERDCNRLPQVTGGGVFIATDPAKIGEIFLQAIALRPTTTR
jgi:hypothetical protein